MEDEIQKIKGWEKVVNFLMSDCNVDIYVVGSNSRMMSSELFNYLAGRYVSFRIYPLAFVEYPKFRKVDPLERVVRYAFDNMGNTFSAASITKYLKSEQQTLDTGQRTTKRYMTIRAGRKAPVFSAVVVDMTSSAGSFLKRRRRGSPAGVRQTSLDRR